MISYGRGFVVNYDDHHRIVLTASHCLRFFPPCHRVSYLEERTCKALLAPLGRKLAVTPPTKFESESPSGGVVRFQLLGE